MPLAERISAAGGDPDRIGDAAWAAADIAGFLELHIEQGPVLEAAGTRIGVVTAVTGQAKVEAVITGAANHAGTTPMTRRRDAAVGVLRAGPGVSNVIPGEAVLGIDLRDADHGRITAAIERLGAAALDIAGRTGTTIELRPGAVTRQVGTDPWMASCVVTAANTLGAPWQYLPSGAGHDAQIRRTLDPWR